MKAPVKPRASKLSADETPACLRVLSEEELVASESPSSEEFQKALMEAMRKAEKEET